MGNWLQGESRKGTKVSERRVTILENEGAIDEKLSSLSAWLASTWNGRSQPTAGPEQSEGWS